MHAADATSSCRVGSGGPGASRHLQPRQHHGDADGTPAVGEAVGAGKHGTAARTAISADRAKASSAESMDVPTPRTRAGSPTHPCIHTCMPTHTRAHTHIRASKHTSPGRRRHGIAARLRHKTYRISRATPVDSRCVCSAAPAQTDAVVAPPLNVPSCCRMQPRPSHRVRRKTCTVLLTRDGVHATYDPSDASNGRYNVRLAAHQGGGERAGHRQAVPSAPGGSTRRARACWMLCAGVQGSRATRALTWLTHTCTPRTRRQFVERRSGTHPDLSARKRALL
jgi:hypothetical protein